ncbi:MAG: N-acetylmuramoyl-L-alanine amidase family protein [Solirubrobacteraceae bacterium]
MRSVRALLTVLWLPALLVACSACGGSTRATARDVDVTSDAAQPVDRSVFAPGACVAFAPTGPVRHLTVFLDAGHGGRDPGAVGSTESGRRVYEADQTLSVELDTMALLRAGGFRVVVSRTRDSSVLRLGPGEVSGGVLTATGAHADVAARDMCANDAHANVLVGIYFNGGAPSSAGALTAYDAVRPFAAQNHSLARFLQRDVLAAMNAQGWRIPDDRVKEDVGLGSAVNSKALAYGHLMLIGPASPGYFSTPSRMPGALIEPLFVTDPFEATIAANHHGQEVIARAIAKAIEHYFAPGS